MEKTRAERIVEQDIYNNQTYLVDTLITNDLLSYDDIYNLYDPETDEFQEVFQWFNCSDWLADRMNELGYPIINSDLGTWYGRTCFGQSLHMDYNIRLIAGEIEEEQDEDEFSDDQLQRLGAV